MTATRPLEGRIQPVVSVKRLNRFATLPKNVSKDSLVSGEMSGFPMCGSLDSGFLEI